MVLNYILVGCPWTNLYINLFVEALLPIYSLYKQMMDNHNVETESACLPRAWRLWNSVSHKNTKEGNEANKNTNTGKRSIEGALQRQIRQTAKWNCFRRVYNGNIKNGLNHPLLFVTKNVLTHAWVTPIIIFHFSETPSRIRQCFENRNH